MADGRLEKELAFYEKMDKKLQAYPAIISEYYMYMRANRKSYTSINVYICNVLHFANACFPDGFTNKFYNELEVEDVEEYFISLAVTIRNGKSTRTGDDILQQRWSSLRYFYDFLIKRKGYNKPNPILLIERPKNQTEHTVTYLTEDEVQQLLWAVSTNPHPVWEERDSAIFKLALATGLRISAITNLNVEDIDLLNQTVNVIEKRMKVRQIPIGNKLCSVLESWINTRTEYLNDVTTNALFISKYGDRISTDRINQMLERYCDIAGIKRITAHKLRATAACTLAKNNIPTKAIAKQLGHNDVKTTMRYIDVFNEDIEKTVKTLDNLF